jgi:radical SAM protein with 4Fe4S-binding SPASM domain
MIFNLHDYRELFPAFSGKDAIIGTDRPDGVIDLHHQACDHGINVYCVVLSLQGDLVDIDLRDEWQNIPLVICIDQVGPYIKLYNRLPELHSLDIKVVFRTESSRVYRDIRVLSSLGIPSELVLSDNPDWDAFYSLLIYSLYARQPHSPIYPFQDILNNLKTGREHFFCRGIFENPFKYLHVTKDGQMSLGKNYAVNGQYISTESIEKQINNNNIHFDEIIEWKLQRRYLLTNYNSCSSCKGWLACGGCFYDKVSDKQNCEKIFAELVHAAEETRNRRSIKKTWQHSY